MIYLQFPQGNTQIEKWQERLNNLIVSYQAEQTPSLKQPVMTEGKQEFVGPEAIEKFLKELEEEVNDWRTPRCGV